jgi:hypothetical protein
LSLRIEGLFTSDPPAPGVFVLQAIQHFEQFSL